MLKHYVVFTVTQNPFDVANFNITNKH